MPPTHVARIVSIHGAEYSWLISTADAMRNEAEAIRSEPVRANKNRRTKKTASTHIASPAAFVRISGKSTANRDREKRPKATVAHNAANVRDRLMQRVYHDNEIKAGADNILAKTRSIGTQTDANIGEHMKIGMALIGIIATLGLMARGDDVRRITLDGKDGAKPPVAEPGKDKIDRIHKVEQPQLMLYPCAKKPSHGTVMVCPGGGYSILAVNHEGMDIAKMLNDDGWDAAVLLYHVSEGDKTRTLAIEDAKAGLALIQKRGGEFGLETKKVGVMGFSAGGHLSARVTHEAAAAGNPPDFAVLMYPAYLEKNGVISDEVAPTKVPAFLYVAQDDKYNTSSHAFEAACKEKGFPCEAHYAEKGGHGFGLKNPLPEGVKDWPDKLRAFLDKQE